MKSTTDRLTMVALIFSLVVLFSASGFIASEVFLNGKLEEFGLNISAEILGFFVGVFISGIAIERKAKMRTERELFEALVLDMGGESNEFAKRAVRILWHHSNDYMRKGMLVGKSFTSANLSGADMGHSNLGRVDLTFCNLESALIRNANLSYAKLSFANLLRADLLGSNLAYANLYGSNLKGVKLVGANLYQVDLREAEFDAETVLPDGQHWSPAIDLSQYLESFIDTPTADMYS